VRTFRSGRRRPKGRRRFPCTFVKACNVTWAVIEMGWTQTQAAIEIGLNSGTVNHIVHGRRFPNAYPVPLPGYE
jgi:hypothetical protein